MSDTKYVDDPLWWRSSQFLRVITKNYQRLLIAQYNIHNIVLSYEQFKYSNKNDIELQIQENEVLIKILHTLDIFEIQTINHVISCRGLRIVLKKSTRINFMSE